MYDFIRNKKKTLDSQVKCYLDSSQSENLAEREAACCSISEIAAKIERECVLPYVVPLLEALIKCSKAESWSVRDGTNSNPFVLNS
jgi:hypothetical protein